MTEPDPIDFQAWSTPDPSPSLTRDILDRVGQASAAPTSTTPRLAMIAAAVVAAAAAAMIIWKLRTGETERIAPAVAVDERGPDRMAIEPLETRSTPVTQRVRRLTNAVSRARLLDAITSAHAQQPAGSGGLLSLSPREVQEAMQEVRPLLAECHEMARERSPGLAGTLKVRMTLVGEPGLATIVAAAEAEPDEGLSGDPDLLECITETLLSLELAAPAVGGTMTVTYPFVFRPTADTNDRPRPTHRLPVTTRPDPSPASAGSLVDRARTAAKGGEWGRALVLSQEALAADPTDTDALMVGVLAACNLKNADLARDYAGSLSGPRQGMARQACLRNGIDTDD